MKSNKEKINTNKNVLIIYQSIHHGNTKKIAKVMAAKLNADLIKPEDFKTIGKYNLIGFGSGIYDYKHHASILNLVDKLSNLKGKKVFIFSTCGLMATDQHENLRERLKNKKAEIVGEFFCRGFNTNSFLKYIGGMNRGRPNEKDLEKAKEFVFNIKSNF